MKPSELEKKTKKYTKLNKAMEAYRKAGNGMYFKKLRQAKAVLKHGLSYRNLQEIVDSLEKEIEETKKEIKKEL